MRKQGSILTWALLAACILAGAQPSRAAETPAAAVALVDLREADASTRLALVCLQGIVNRGADGPRLFCLHTAQDAVWFDQLYAHRGFQPKTTSPAEAIERFAPQVKARVLYDPAQPEQVNLATALAGLEDALPVTDPAIGGASPVVEDLRTRFKNRAEALQWAMEKVLPRCHKEKVALVEGACVAVRDYLVDQRIFPIWPDPKSKDDALALQKLLERFPAGAAVLWSGSPGSPAETRALLTREPASSIPGMVRLAGKCLIPGVDVGNLSFHSRIPAAAPLRQVRRHLQYAPVKYVAFLIAGDSRLDFAFGRMRELWDDPARGLLPLNWEIHPALGELAPSLAAFYYTDARWGGNDQFVMAASGAGYLPPTDAPAWTPFREATGKAVRA
ncbi:MAG: GxGYxYP family putative glycoside hydrolase, partial [Armatimonadota bacterium]|nr:GxGYxYP family putative glycoside hydrolase [Armatimonadota bacterium]